jgi:hypothetical protein
MKKLIWLALFLFTALLQAEVLFYDDFDRPDGPVGNGWTNIGPAVSSIENNAMKLISDNNKGIKREFTPVAGGSYYIQFDWKLAANDWLADAFPNDIPAHLLWDYEGNLYRDPDGSFAAPILLGNVPLNTWATIRWLVNLDTDRYSLWINDALAADNILGNEVSSSFRFTFRSTAGSTSTQYVDNFLIYNDAAPAVPANFTATGSVNEVTLDWDLAPDTDFLTYRIYRDTTSPAATLLSEIAGTQDQYIDISAESNTDYFYRIKAVSMGTLESDYSNEATAHLQPLASIEPMQVCFNVGFGYSDSTNVTIYNNGSYPLHWQVSGSQEMPLDGLIAYYPFNGNTMNEVGLSQYDAINYGAVYTEDRFCNPISALDFNGVNSHLLVNESIEFENEMSLSCWVNERQVTNAGGIISCIEEWSLYATTWGEPGVRFYSDGAGSILDAYFPLNQWHHIVAIASSNYKRLYIDGELAAYNDVGGVAHSGAPIYVGYYGYSYYWDGMIDDVAIFNRVLTQEEIISLYNGTYNTNNGNLLCLPSSSIVDSNGSQSLLLKINRTDLTVGTHVDTLFVQTNDPLHPLFEIVVTINVYPPDPIITPQPITLAFNNETQTQQTDITLSNNGTGRLFYTLSGGFDQGYTNPPQQIDGFILMGTFNGNHYYKSINSMTWQTAKTLCEQNGGHLAVISNQEEGEFVYQNSLDYAWLGLTDEAVEGQWVWVTDEPLTYVNWFPGEPNGSTSENYAEMGSGYGAKWNDSYSSYSAPYAILEIESATNSQWSFTPSAGIVESGDSEQVILTIDGHNLEDGIYTCQITLSALGMSGTQFYDVIINVDYTPPIPVAYLAVDPLNTDANQIGITWSANAVADSVVAYKISRRGRDETEWSLKGTVPPNQLWFIDDQFTGLDSTYVWYRVRAEDWVGNLSAEGDSLQAALERFLAPENLQISQANGRDVHLTWNPVTQTISGLPGTPSCYIVYKSQTPLPLSEFDFLDVSFTNEYTHPWVLYFQPADRLFYIVTAYGGNMGRLDALLAEKKGWKYRELESRLWKRSILTK